MAKIGSAAHPTLAATLGRKQTCAAAGYQSYTESDLGIVELL